MGRFPHLFARWCDRLLWLHKYVEDKIFYELCNFLIATENLGFCAGVRAHR